MEDKAGRDEVVWAPWVRVAFQFFFVFLLQLALGSDHKTIVENLPFGRRVQGWMSEPYLRVSSWIAVHWLHLGGAAAVPHPSAFADRALDWITVGVMLAVAVLATVVWSAVDGRKSYTTMWLWLRLVLRYTVALSMMWYGSIKFWPIQIGHPSLAVLNENVGNLTPMTLLWTLLGSNETYERVCGVVETVCGLLLLFRRTAFSGALLAVVILSNIVLFDVFFDVPVRLYAAGLLLMTGVMLAPDLRSFFDFVWLRKTAALTSLWAPEMRTQRARYALVAAEAVLVLLTLKAYVNHGKYEREEALQRNPPAVAGEWRVDASFLPGDVGRRTLPFVTPEGAGLAEVFLEPSGRLTERAVNGRIFTAGSYNDEAKTMEMSTLLLAGVKYWMVQADQEHLTLVPVESGEPQMELTRVPLPTHYPLFERRIPLVEEYEYER